MEFEWDANNIGHIARHRVTPEEVEQCLSGFTIVNQSQKVPGRREAYGRTSDGRYLVVVYEQTTELVRPVTAYPMNRSKRSQYAPQLTAKNI